MRKACLTFFVVIFASAAFAQTGTVLLWRQIVGDITAPGAVNMAAGIPSGSSPWTTTDGLAIVNLGTGAVAFQVRGLVLNGTNASGTPGPVQSVIGTVVCGAGTSGQATFDTSTVTLSAQGDAVFAGNVSGLPSSCATPLFLIRVGTGSSAPWIATGAVLVTITSQ